MSRGIAFLAGLGSGYLDEDRRQTDRKREDARYAKDQARLDARDRREAENHDFVQSERARADADRTELRAAAAPQTVAEVPGVATDAEAAPMPATFKVGARSFAERGAADAAAAEANTPQATRSRIASVITKHDPVRGDQFRTAGLQGDAADLALRKHTGDMLKEGTLDALGAAMEGRSPDEIKALYNQAGGKRIATIAVEPFEFDHPTLGRQRSARVKGTFEDGTQLTVPDAFTLSTQLLGAAKRFDLLGQWTKDKASRDAQSRGLDIQQQSADTMAAYRRDQGAHFKAMEGIAAGKAAAGAGPAQVTLKDKRDFESDLSAYIKDQFPIRDGASQQERDGTAAQANAVRAQAQTMFHTNATLGSPQTAGTIGQAMLLARDRKNISIFKTPDGAAYEGVMVNGQPVMVSAPLQRKPPAAAAPGAPAVAAPPAVSPRAAEVPTASNFAPGAGTPAGMASQGVQMPGQSENTQEHVAALQPMNAQVQQLAQALAAAAQSGDQQAIALYGAQLESAKQARNQEAVRRLGPDQAQQYINSLPA